MLANDPRAADVGFEPRPDWLRSLASHLTLLRRHRAEVS